MQKKIIALAVAGLVSGAAFAESNVTIYGVMDATYDNVSATGSSAPYGTVAAPQAGLPSRGRTTFNSSYIGFKGVESLGNGYAVAFQVETGFTGNAGGFGNTTAPNNNTASGSGWATRDTYVGLAGPFGTVAFGNLTGPTRALGAAFDVNPGDTGIGSNGALLGKLGGGSGAGYFDQRISNAIAYISPNMSGFSGVLGYLPNSNRGSDGSIAAGTASSVQQNTSAWTLGLNYANGPITAGFAYTDVKDSNVDAALGSGYKPATYLAGPAVVAGVLATTATPISKIDNTRLGVKYDFGMGTVGLLWDRTKATISVGSTAGAGLAALGGGADMDATQTVWYLPVTFKVGGNGTIIAQYGHANNVSGSLVSVYGAAGVCSGTSGCDYSAKHFEIGYQHDLSKRTQVKVLWSQITNAKDAGYDFLYGVSAGQTAGYGAGSVANGSDPRGLSLGIRHSF